MRKILYALAVVIAFCIGYGVGDRHKTSSAPDVTVDTFTMVTSDTVRDTVLVPVENTIVRWKIMKVPVVDTVTQTVIDSTLTALPVTQKQYSDSNYRAWVSGIDPNLDSIHIYRRSTVNDIVHTVRDRSRWNLGIQAGIGVSNGKIAPYFGIGASYVLLRL